MTTQTSEQNVCRICLCTENEDNEEFNPTDINPLISPCKCTGTISYIHLKCLRGWLESKCTRKVHRKHVMVKFKKMDCELCKVTFPYKVTWNNQIIDIVEVERPIDNFIILESLSNEDTKIFYIVNTEDLRPMQNGQSLHSLAENQKIRVGRSAESDVRVADDISVSRSHAFIQKSLDGDYYISDNNSKFGTLVLVQYPIFIGSDFTTKPVVVQSGKTCLSFSLQLPVNKCQRFCQAISSCTRNIKRKPANKDNLVTVDGKCYFPSNFIDKEAAT